MVQARGPYRECTDWRTSAMAQIAALHPALVIAAEARSLEEPEARPLLKGEERQLAEREHVDRIDPTSWFCTRRPVR